MTDAPRANGFLSRGGMRVVAQSILMTAVVGLGVIFRGDWTRLVIFAGVSDVCNRRLLWNRWKSPCLVAIRTPFPRPREGSELVQRGIYAKVRHPLYTSVMLASLGWALIWQSRPALIAALVLIPFFHAKARREEEWLRKQFPDYVDYERRMPRFIPRLFPTSKSV